MFDKKLINYFILFILIILFIILIICIFKENFNTIPPVGVKNIYVETLPTISEQESWNNKFMKKYDKLKENEDNKPFMWNDNNSLESMKLNPCLGKDTNRLTCYSAPAWWYPYDKYDSDKFREIYYGDYFNPIYNYLGNAQDMYWDFKSVKNS